MPKAIEPWIERVSHFLSIIAKAHGANDPEPIFPEETDALIGDSPLFYSERNGVSKPISYAIFLLRELDAASISDHNERPDVFSIALNDMKTVNALLDFLVIDGIYPNISCGVGIPIAKRRKGPPSRENVSQSQNLDTLKIILRQLLKIVDSEDDVSTVVMGGQYSTDILSGLAEIGYNPRNKSDSQSPSYQKFFQEFIERCLIVI